MISLLALTLVLCIFDGGSILCEASSISNSQSRRRNFDSKPKVDTAQREAKEIKEGQDGYTMSQQTLQQEPQSAGYYDFLIAAIFGGVSTEQKEIKEPVKVSAPVPVKLATCTISGNDAVLLAPALFKNLDMMVSNLKKIHINEITITAIKFKSLEPNLDIEIPSSPCTVYVDEFSNMTLNATIFHVFDSINLLIKKLPDDAQFDVVKQVFGFDLEGRKTLNEFIKEKESEIAQPLEECSAEVARLKNLLYCTTSISNIKLNSISIKLIVNQLHKLNKVYEQIQELQSMLVKSSNQTNSIHEIHKRIGKIMEALSEILEKL